LEKSWFFPSLWKMHTHVGLGLSTVCTVTDRAHWPWTRVVWSVLHGAYRQRRRKLPNGAPRRPTGQLTLCWTCCYSIHSSTRHHRRRESIGRSCNSAFNVNTKIRPITDYKLSISYCNFCSIRCPGGSAYGELLPTSVHFVLFRVTCSV